MIMAMRFGCAGQIGCVKIVSSCNKTVLVVIAETVCLQVGWDLTENPHM